MAEYDVNPVTREEKLLDKIAGGSTAVTPATREEKLLANIDAKVEGIEDAVSGLSDELLRVSGAATEALNTARDNAAVLSADGADPGDVLTATADGSVWRAAGLGGVKYYKFIHNAKIQARTLNPGQTYDVPASYNANLITNILDGTQVVFSTLNDKGVFTGVTEMRLAGVQAESYSIEGFQMPVLIRAGEPNPAFVTIKNITSDVLQIDAYLYVSGVIAVQE